jgi:hypothetical protein
VGQIVITAYFDLLLSELALPALEPLLLGLLAPALPEVEPLALFCSSFMHLSRSALVRPTHLDGVAEALPAFLPLALLEAALPELGLDCAQAAVAKARKAAVTAALMSFNDMRSSGWRNKLGGRSRKCGAARNAPLGGGGARFCA